MPTHHHRQSAAGQLGKAFLRDLSSLLITSRSLTRSLSALRPGNGFTPEMINQINELITIAREGEDQLFESLRAAHIDLPAPGDAETIAAAAPSRSRLAQSVSTAEQPDDVILNLRLLVQHLELRARLVAEEAKLVGQRSLRRALLAWATEWYTCGKNLLAAAGSGARDTMLGALPPLAAH